MDEAGFDDELLYDVPIDLLQWSVYYDAAKRVGIFSSIANRLMTSSQEAFKHNNRRRTIEQMLSYQSNPLPCSLLLSTAPLTDQAISLFNDVLQFSTRPDIFINDAISSAHKILQLAFYHQALKDELYLQLFKQTRSNPHEDQRLKIWKLLHLVSSTLPPPDAFVTLLALYFVKVRNDSLEPDQIRAIASDSLIGLRTTLRAGQRRLLPTPQEIATCLDRRLLETIVHHIDGSFEDVPYGIGTTVKQVVDQVASLIRLKSSYGFALFERRAREDDKVLTYGLYDYSYIADVVAESEQRISRSETSCLVFKKAVFTESDEIIAERASLDMCYFMTQQDYKEGKFLVTHDQATYLCALQIYCECNQRIPDDDRALMDLIEEFTSQGSITAGSQDLWRRNVRHQFQSIGCTSPQEAQICFLRTLKWLPHSRSVLFEVRTRRDPLGLLPPKVILGVNHSGVHFFKCVPEEYIASVQFRDIKSFEYGNKSIRFYFVLHEPCVYEFESSHGDEIKMAIDTGLSVHKRMKYSDSNRDYESALMELDFGKSYEAHISSLTSEIETADIQIEELTTAISREEYQLDSLRCDLGDLVRQIDELSNSKKEWSMYAAAALDVSNLKVTLRSIMEYLGVQDEEKFALVRDIQLGHPDIELHLQEAKEANRKLRHRLQEIEDGHQANLEELKRAISWYENSDKEQHSDLNSKKNEVVEQVGVYTAMVDSLEKELKIERQRHSEILELRRLKVDLSRRWESYQNTIEAQAQRIQVLPKLTQSERSAWEKAYETMLDLKGRIRVCARVRPLIPREKLEDQPFVLKFPSETTIQHSWIRNETREYTFDSVMQPDATQSEVFDYAKDLIQSAVAGFNVSIFAYGQTGSGKTFTINGTKESPGLVPRSIEKLFEILAENAEKATFTVKCSMVELYRDTLEDLLSKKKPIATPERKSSLSPRLSTGTPRSSLSVPGSCRDRGLSRLSGKDGARSVGRRENGINSMMRGMKFTEKEVKTAQELKETFSKGEKKRHTSATEMNADSSRSHLIFMIKVDSVDRQIQSTTAGKLFFVDLAGSERLKKSGSTGEQLKEAQAINKSLSALGDVISALAKKESHIPYRNHKLTMLMSDVVGGNSKTLMFVNVSPSGDNLDETQNSLQYASRVRSIQNSATRQTNRDLSILKTRLQAWKSITKDQIECILDEYC